MPVKTEVTDPEERIRRLARSQEGPIQVVFLQALQVITNSHTLDELADLLERGQIEEALRDLEAAGELLGNGFGTAIAASAASTADWLSRNALDLPISYDGTNPLAVAVIQRSRLDLITAFTTQQREAVREALLIGAQTGLGPREQARLFRNSIGLTARQVRAIENYRLSLENLSSDALRRELRDARFDRTVLRAIRDKVVLPREQIDKMVDRYRERFLRFRTEMVARTEALTAANTGSFEMYEQAMQNGAISPDEIVRTWVSAGDSRVRDSHARLNGQQKRPGELWQGDFSALRHPHDPAAAAQERIQCRCTLKTQLFPRA